MAASLLRLLLGVTFLYGAAWAVCPDGYMDPGKDIGRCFRLGKEIRNWQEARSECVNEGGDLLSFRDDKEKGWFESPAVKRRLGLGMWWTGLNSPSNPGEWEWSDGTPYDSRVVKWTAGQVPNNPNERCAIYSRSIFQAKKCEYRKVFICARSKNVPIVCPRGYTMRKGFCYKYYDVERRWTQARLDCGYYGGDLADVLSEDDQKFVWGLVNQSSRGAWLGMRSYKNIKKIDYVWVTGDYNTNATFWANGEPRIASGQETNSCLKMTKTGNYTNNWAMKMCNLTFPYVCKRPQGGCAPGWRIFQNHCFRIYNGDDEKAWPEAKKFCDAQNAALITIKEVMRQLFVMRYLKVIEKAGSETLWLGARYQVSNKELRWVTGEKVTYNNFSPGQPKFDKSRDSCMMMRADNEDGPWEMNNNCYGSMAFVCYAKAGTNIIDPTPAPPQRTCDFEINAREKCVDDKDLVKNECEARDCCYDNTNRPGTDIPKCFKKRDSFTCPPDWQLLKSHCYLFRPDTNTAWVAARRKCSEYRGDLADIRDEETQIFFNKHHRDDSCWLGLNDRLQEGKFVWLDETKPTNFSNWASGQPDDKGGRRKNCVYAGEDPHGQWYDEDCSRKMGHVCKIPATPTGTIATTTAPPKPSRCGLDWVERAGTDWCYQVNRPEITWYDARAACADHRAQLTSITSSDETNFLKDLMKPLGSAEVWMGLDGLRKPGLFRWLDDQPLNYHDWAKGEPARGQVECGAILKANGKWKLQQCTRTNSYICKRLVDGVLTTLVPPTSVPPLPGNRVACPVGTHEFRNHCYSFIKKRFTWTQSRDYCRKLGKKADLATISEQRDNDFIWSKSREIFGYKGGADRVWIGMYDKTPGTNGVNVFHWSDNSPVTYTNWDAFEPSNIYEKCIDFWMQHGRWNDERCHFEALGFVCRQPQVQQSVTVPTTLSPTGCPPLYHVAWEDSCYAVINEPSSWEGANNYCFNNGGYALDILNAAEQSFVSAYLQTREENDFWIGLGKSGDGEWKWTSGKPVRYTNWCSQHNDEHNCVAIHARPGANDAGKWMNHECFEQRPFICKVVNTQRGTRPPRTTVPPSLGCPKGWLVAGDYCYKGFSPYFRRFMKTWPEARDYCRTLGGDLASIHDREANKKIGFVSGSREMWIGLNQRDPRTGLMWSDGRAYNYANWAPGEPDSHLNQEQCAVYRVSQKVNGNYYKYVWSLNTCAVVRPFACGILRGRTPRPTPPIMTTVVDQECGEGWQRWGDWCYNISRDSNKRAPWRVARSFYCLTRGGDLASITSPEENNFITAMITRQVIKTSVWIGLNELDLDDFKWSDGTQVTFKNWDRAQPNDRNHALRCAVLDSSSGFWQTDNCAEPHMYVCKKRPNTFTPMTTVPTTTIAGYCPNGGYSLGNKCIYVIPGGKNASKSWDEALTACTSYGPYASLVSIHSKAENTKLNLVMDTNTGPYWIGLNDKKHWRRWRWLDNSHFDYSSWAEGEPSGKSTRPYRQPCVVMADGKWFSQSCEQPHGYLCQLVKKPSNVVPTPPTQPPNQCGDKKFTQVGGNCYKVINDRRRWSEARTACAAYNADLASIDSMRINGVLRQLNEDIKNTERYWIGLNDIETPGFYKWSDRSLVQYTSWAPKQPVRPVGGGCVASDPTGQWYDGICDYQLPYACKITINPGPTAPPVVPGSCPGNDWHPFGSYCYKFPAKSDYTKFYSSAQDFCKKAGGQLASIHNPSENTYLASTLYSLKRNFNAWIGMIKKGGKYVWDDDTPVDFTNWAEGITPTDKQECVMMDRRSGKWLFTTCTTPILYICRALKDGIPTPTAVPTGTPTSPAIPGTACKNDKLGFVRGDFCYRFITRIKADNDYAEYECQKLRGHLVSLHSSEENDFVRGILRSRSNPPAQDAWIGYKKQSSGIWLWNDRSASNYKNWELGMPGHAPKHDCAVISAMTGKWSDRKCDQYTAFVCKFKDVPKPTGPATTTPKPTFAMDPCPGRKNAYQMGDYCYQVTMDDIKKQQNARQECRVRGGELSSVHDTELTNYLLQLVDRDQTIEKQNLWIGLIRTRYVCDLKPSRRRACGGNPNITRADCLAKDCCHDGEARGNSPKCYEPDVDPRGKYEWRWTDNTRYDFTNWAKGYPTKLERDACVDFGFEDGKWKDVQCLEQRGYICRYPFGMAISTTIKVEQCPFRDDAVLFGDYCYHVVTTSIIPRASARAQCQMLGGDLASIHDGEENNFVLYDLMRRNGESDIWLGLEKNATNSFSWSDNTRFDYTNWGPGEPSLKGECVKMVTVTGKWTEEDCIKNNGFVCKYPVGPTKPTTTPTITPTIAVEQCPYKSDAIAYGDYCYMVNVDSRVPWSTARLACAEVAPGADLTSVHSEDENRYLLQEITRKQAAADLWLGAIIFGTNWGWVDNTDMDYLNWGMEKPSATGECSVFDKTSGQWKDSGCSGLYGFVCKFSKASVTPRPTLPPLTPCPFRKGAYELGDWCYQTTTNDLHSQAWARQSCRARGGELASIHNAATSQFLMRVWNAGNEGQNNLWIGLVRTKYICKINKNQRRPCPNTPADIKRSQCLERDCCWDSETPRSPNCYQSDVDPRGKYEWRWTDTTAYDYTNWATGFPTDMQREACVETNYITGKWRDIGCDDKRGFICRFPMGFPMPTTVKVTPCPFRKEAILLGDYCYHVVTTTIINRPSARAQCQMNGGDLVSIHDAGENHFVLQDLMRMNGEVDIWLGLQKTNGNFTWSDRTRLDFSNWGPGEPSLKGECVKMVTVTGKWIEVNCAMTNGYACKYPMGEPIQTTTPAMRPTFSVQKCPFRDDAILFGQYCYAINPQNVISAGAAMAMCQQYGTGATLVSVHDRDENNYLMQEVLRMQSGYDLWMGAISLSTDWAWLDGSSMDYLNWAPRMPIGRGECSRMDKNTGMWKDTDCGGVYGYICKFPSSAVTPKPTYPVIQCPARPEAFYYNGACYDLKRDANLNQRTSRSICLSRGGDLASLHSRDESEYVNFIANRSPEITVRNIWIGLVREDANAAWRWTDGTFVDFTYWAGRGPTPNGHCADMDRVSGRWLNTECDKQRGYVCKYTTGITTTPISIMTTPKRCPVGGSRWWERGKYCYYVSLTDRVSQHSASDYCKYGQFKGHLTSIHCAEENGFMFTLIKQSGGVGAGDAWIGLQKIGGEWQWTDGSQVDYTNWIPGRPQPGGGNCVDMDRTNGMWRDTDCNSYRGYSCKFNENQPIVSPTPTFSPGNKCPVKGARWWEQGKNCYTVSTQTNLTYNSAFYNCRYGSDGNLVSIHSQSENDFVVGLVRQNGAKNPANIWIGLKKVGGFWQWSDGTAYDYQNWERGRPLPNHGGNCVAMDRFNGRWLDIACDSFRGYSCKYPEANAATTPTTTAVMTTPTRCPVGDGSSDWWERGRNCYLIKLTARVSQNAGSDRCKYASGNIQGRLTSIHNAAENSYMFTLLKLSNAPGVSNPWIGLQKINGRWQWTDGSSLDYVNWTPGRPSDDGGACVVMDRTSGTWTNQYCNSNMGYSCKFNQDNQIINTPMPTFQPPNRCSVKGAKWWEMGNNCYLISPKTDVSHSQAYYNCKYGNDGGNLVSIHTFSENHFVLGLVRNSGAQRPANIWIGLRKNGGSWKWVDGSAMDYTNWASGRPLPGHGGSCAEMDRYTGKWLDIDCDSLRGYSCKYPENTAVSSPANTPIVVTVHPVTGLSSGATAGIVVGSLLGIALIAFLVIVIAGRIRKKQGTPGNHPDRFSIPSPFSYNNDLYDNNSTEQTGMKLEDFRTFGPTSSES